MFVCVCHAVTDRDIRVAAVNGICSLEALGRQLKVGTSCGRCKKCARKVLEESMNEICCLGYCATGGAA